MLHCCVQAWKHEAAYLIRDLDNWVDAVANVLQADVTVARLAVSQFFERNDRVNLPYIFGLHHETNGDVGQQLIVDCVENLELSSSRTGY